MDHLSDCGVMLSKLSKEIGLRNHHVRIIIFVKPWDVLFGAGDVSQPALFFFRGPTKARCSAMAEVVIHPFGVLHVACRFKKTTVIGQINLAMTL